MSKFEFVQTNRGEEQVVRHGRRGQQTTKLKCYDVLVDGEKIGSVDQGMATFDRKPRGSRIVTSRWSSPRWYYDKPPGAHYYRGHYETRERAAEALAQEIARVKPYADALGELRSFVEAMPPGSFTEVLERLRSSMMPVWDRTQLVLDLTDGTILTHPSLDRLRKMYRG